MTAKPTARNALCHCGSGLRYKACCGRIPAAQAEASASADAELELGRSQLHGGDREAALRTLLGVARRHAETPEPVLRDLAIAVASLLASRAPVESEALWLDCLRWASTSRTPQVARDARVSIVVPSYNHAAYIESALDSALQQSRPAHEIVVIDDGSADGSPDRIRAFADRHRDSVRAVARERRGAAATLDEAIRMARGDWIAVLNSDDRFTPDRLEAMVDGVAGAGASWGYSRCRFIDADGAIIPPGASPQADRQRNALDLAGTFDTVGFGFIAGNLATSSGTLFFSRALFDRVGGFSDLRYVHDWDFCLRATLEAEPAFVARDLYEYRLHGMNTILGGVDLSNAECVELLTAYYRQALAHDGSGNPYAPVAALWGRTFTLRAIEAGAHALLPAGTVERLADELVVELAR